MTLSRRVVRVCGAWCLPSRSFSVGWCVSVACHRVAKNAPTSLSPAQRCVSRCVTHPPQSLDCVRVRPPSDPRPCARPLSWRARSSPRWHVCVLASASVVTPPPLIRRGPRCAMHPPLRCAWLGRDASLRQSPPSRRRLPHRGGVFAPAPFLPRVRSPAGRNAVSSRRKRPACTCRRFAAVERGGTSTTYDGEGAVVTQPSTGLL